MARYLLQASDSEFDLWRAAARAAAGEGAPLSKWIRARLNEAAGERADLERRAALVLNREPRHVPEGARTEPAFRPVVSTNRGPYEPSFKPDFGSRLKKEGKR